MELSKKMDPNSLRLLAGGIADGGVALPPTMCAYFSVQQGQIVGCCALGAVLISLNPGLLDFQDHGPGFGTMEDASGDHLTGVLTANYPILDATDFAPAFLAKFSALASPDEIAAMSEVPLISAIAYIHDETSADRAAIAAALFDLGDEVEQVQCLQ